MHEVKGYLMGVVLNVLRECVRQSSEAAHPHFHREVLALDRDRRNVVGKIELTDEVTGGTLFDFT